MRFPSLFCAACGITLATLASAGPLDRDNGYTNAFEAGAGWLVQVGPSAVQPDGKAVVITTVYPGTPGVDVPFGRPPNRLFVRRFNSDGSRDPGFGINGVVEFSVGGSDTVKMVKVQNDGKILLAVEMSEVCTEVRVNILRSCVDASGSFVPLLAAAVRLTPEGFIDATFNGGIVPTEMWRADAVAQQPDGKVLLLGTNSTVFGLSFGSFSWSLARFNKNGTRDLTFNGGQSVRSQCPWLGHSIALQPDGKIVAVSGFPYEYLSAPSIPQPGFCVERRLADGSPDTTFSNHGSLETPFSGMTVEPRNIFSLPGGKTLATGWVIDSEADRYVFVAARFLEDGSLDPSYGTAGKVVIPMSQSGSLEGSELTRDGGLIAVAFERTGELTGNNQWRTVWIRLTEAGERHRFFGTDGIARTPLRGRPGGFMQDAEGRWLLLSSIDSVVGVTGTIARYKGESIERDVVNEYYNTTLDHYFITADPNEAAGIERGAAGPGWLRTYGGFASGGSTPVCRFYGSVSPGPNSHFFTVHEGECAFLRELQARTPPDVPRWNFEGRDFLSTPHVDGVCPSPLIPVYRAYNNGFPRIDSNHRITADPEAISEVVARGWIAEGVKMCAPLRD